MSLPAFIPCPERTVKLKVLVGRLQILLDVRVSLASATRMMRGLKAAAITLFIAIEVTTLAVIVRPLAVPQLAPPALTQIIEIHRAGVVKHCFGFVHLIVIFRVGDND